MVRLFVTLGRKSPHNTLGRLLSEADKSCIKGCGSANLGFRIRMLANKYS